MDHFCLVAIEKFTINRYFYAEFEYKIFFDKSIVQKLFNFKVIFPYVILKKLKF